MIEARGLTKRYGSTLAVNDLSFTVHSGRVTGFLGPNGAGKSTTMRMILALDRPTAGEVLIGGQRYADLREPLRHVGALLDARWVHPNRSARAHLRWMARSNRLPTRRVDEVLDLVGLSDVASKRAGGFSLGMSQRLGVAAALLGDPGVLLFDEPVNGLDPEGILWIRRFMHSLADEGRTVLVSSHLLSEMSLTAQELVVIGRGRMIAQSRTEDFIAAAAESSVRVRSPELDQLRAVLVEHGLSVVPEPATADAPAGLLVANADTERVGELAGRAGLILHELTSQRASLEQAFLQLTGQDVEYRAGGPTVDRPDRDPEPVAVPSASLPSEPVASPVLAAGER